MCVIYSTCFSTSLLSDKQHVLRVCGYTNVLFCNGHTSPEEVWRYPVYSSQPLECLKSLAIWVVVLCEASIADVFQYKWSLTILDEGVVVCVWGCANLQHVMGVWSRFVTLTTCVCLSNSVTSFKVSTCKDTRHKWLCVWCRVRAFTLRLLQVKYDIR